MGYGGIVAGNCLSSKKKPNKLKQSSLSCEIAYILFCFEIFAAESRLEINRKGDNCVLIQTVFMRSTWSLLQSRGDTDIYLMPANMEQKM